MQSLRQSLRDEVGAEAREGGRSLVVDDWQVHRARATVLLRVVGRGDARVADDRLHDTTR